MIDKLPTWSRPVLEKLVDRASIPQAEPHDIGPDEAGQLQTMAWIVDTYMRYDENPALDRAMGEPGRVLLEKSELHFDEFAPGSVSASLLGQDKKGRPVAFTMQREPDELEGYSVQKLDDFLFLQGGLITPSGDGFYRTGAVEVPA